MSSYVIVELDTTKPEISMYAPRYTTKELINVITIEANEALSTFQEIYVIDSKGERHNYNFHRELNNQYIGLIKFSDLPVGIATIYSRMKDDVDNYSNIIHTSIEIKESLIPLQIKIKDKSFEIDINDCNKNININSINKNVKIQNKFRNTKINNKERNIKLKNIKRDINVHDNIKEVD